MKGLVLALLFTLAGPAWAAEPFDPFHQAGIDDRADARAPMQTPFRDETGRTVTLAGLAGGKPLVVALVQHRCPTLCGASLQGLAQAADSLPKSGFSLAALSIDPRESPADARASATRLEASGAPAHGLVGDPAAISAVTSALGYRYAFDPRLDQYAHIAAAAVLAPDGRLAGWIYGVAPPPQVLKAAVAAAAHGGVAGLGDRLILLCYHYDPDNGRYTSLTLTLLKAGGIATVLLVAGFIGLMMLREKRA